jgi:hypothetical protein
MDPELLKNLNLDSSINQNDLQLLTQILGSIGPNGNKMPKITAKERNNLINKLSSNNTLNDVPKKELKDMNENEKKIYREELKQKLKNKQNEKKMMRTSNLVKKNTFQNNSNYSDAINKISDMMNINDSTNQIQSSNDQDNTNTLNNEEDKANDNEQLHNLPNLENTKKEIMINNFINQSNHKNNDNLLDDNLDDYLN